MTSVVQWLFRTEGFGSFSSLDGGWAKHHDLAFAIQVFDVLIFFCCTVVAGCLMIIYRARSYGFEIRGRTTGTFLLAGLVLTCGLTYLVDRILFYMPAYGLSCVVKGGCCMTAICTLVWALAPGRYARQEDGG